MLRTKSILELVLTRFYQLQEESLIENIGMIKHVISIIEVQILFMLYWVWKITFLKHVMKTKLLKMYLHLTFSFYIYIFKDFLGF